MGNPNENSFKESQVLNIVTVNYGTSKETLEMISSIEESIGDFFTYCNIVVVDNNSSCTEIEMLDGVEKSNSTSCVQLIKLEQNIGYFPALNVGLGLLNQENDSLTIVCNNDLIFDSVFFDNLSKCCVDENVFAIAPSVKTINSIYQNPSMADKPSKLRMMMYEFYYSNYFFGKLMLKIWRSLGLGIDSSIQKDLEERPIFIGIGAIYILTPNFFKRNKSLSYPLFLYGEEAFFSQQVYNTGGLILYKPALEVLHLESVSTKKIPSKNNYLLNKLAFQNYRKYFWNNKFRK
ncbi:glycosyltransferase family 2 protein [Shewanella sp. 10N.286.52.A9]|uniref:glycosyltransferase family 2 protein n=1 Tax=Shewanella sp. 10N.286.52.A9 TaxID=3229711 RepID=UPI0035545B8E